MSPEITQKINVIVEYFSKNFKGFNTVMDKNLGQFREITTKSGKLNERFKGMNNFGARVAHRFRMLTHGLRGFRMEMLGVMFFGMMINRVFMGLMQTSLEWVGVTELLSAALGLLFLPIALEILNWAIVFLEWVSQLSEEQKKWIGIIVLLGAALGGLIFIIGSFALGLGSMVQAFGSMGIGAATATAKLGVLKSILTTWAPTLISVGFVIYELNKGNVISAIGAGIAGIGFFTGNPWLIGLGLIITLMGDVDLQAQITKLLISIVDQVIAFGETIGKILVNIFSGKKWNVGIDLSGFKKGIQEAAPNLKSGVLQSTMPSFQHGGIVPGSINTPIPIIAHGGERITPADRNSRDANSQIFISPIYNINVSDKREFESMLRENNIKLVEDVRRIVKT